MLEPKWAGPPYPIPRAICLTVTGATESTLQAAAAPILAPPGTPATVGAPQAQGALGCLNTAQGAALGSAEQPPTASGHTPQGQIGGAQTLRGAETAEEERQTHMSWGAPWAAPSSQRPHPCWPQPGGPKRTSPGATASSLLSLWNWKFRPEVRLGTALKLDCVDQGWPGHLDEQVTAEEAGRGKSRGRRQQRRDPHTKD